MATYTSSEANKLLKSYQEQIDALIKYTNQAATFTAAVNENIEGARPDFNFKNTEDKIANLQQKVRQFKHAINIFNTTTTVPGFDMTIDELLVALPQWKQTLDRYAIMKDRLQKTRKQNNFGQSSALIEYIYANYNVSEVAENYAILSAKINKARVSLDALNATCTLHVNLE